MKASEARELAKEACKKEIESIEVLISEEAKKGNGLLSIDNISAGTYFYFYDNGFEIRKISTYHTISW